MEKTVAFIEVLDQVAAIRNKDWAVLEAQASGRTALEAKAAKGGRLNKTVVLIRGKAAAMDALSAAVGSWVGLCPMRHLPGSATSCLDGPDAMPWPG